MNVMIKKNGIPSFVICETEMELLNYLEFVRFLDSSMWNTVLI